MNDTRKATFSKTLLDGGVVLLIALVIYYGAFRGMGSPVTVPVYLNGAIVNEHHPPEYLQFGQPAKPQGIWQTFFLPAWLVDRIIRTDYWYPP